jgi:superfamily I DNA/RNA helicase
MERLVAWLEAFRARDYAAGDVALLSPVREGCAAAKLPEPWASRIRPIESAQPGQGRFTTIAAFKGLEAAIIILTDIVCLATAQEESLLYVGMSRATDRLVILVSEPVRQNLIRLVIGAR